MPYAIGPKLGLGGSTKPASIPIIAVATTLSGAEYVPFAGVTDDSNGVKYQFTGNCKGPALIILSETLALTVPVRTWLASGVRAVDHCIEALCTLKRPEKGWREAEAAAIEGIQCLVPSLLATAKDPSDAKSRRLAQLGVKPSLVPLKNRVFKGASHAIGHFLGPSESASFIDFIDPFLGLYVLYVGAFSLGPFMILTALQWVLHTVKRVAFS